jgi:hypothetical protein
MSTVFPDADTVPAVDEELLEQPTAPTAATAIATAPSAGVSLLPFKV